MRQRLDSNLHVKPYLHTYAYIILKLLYFSQYVSYFFLFEDACYINDAKMRQMYLINGRKSDIFLGNATITNPRSNLAISLL